MHVPGGGANQGPQHQMGPQQERQHDAKEKEQDKARREYGQLKGELDRLDKDWRELEQKVSSVEKDIKERSRVGGPLGRPGGGQFNAPLHTGGGGGPASGGGPHSPRGGPGAGGGSHRTGRHSPPARGPQQAGPHSGQGGHGAAGPVDQKQEALKREYESTERQWRALRQKRRQLKDKVDEKEKELVKLAGDLKEIREKSA